MRFPIGRAVSGPAVRVVFGTLLTGLLVGGCSHTLPRGELGTEGDFNHGKELYDQGRYPEAIEALDGFRNEHPGSDRVDDAIFLLGMAHQKAGEHLLARDEFDRLLRDFPQSSHREEAQYERAMSWLEDSHSPALDPQPTSEALDAFRTYLRDYPDGAHRAEADKYVRVCLDRLATKAYLNGVTYMKLKQPAAARLYFEKSLQILPDFRRAGEAMLETAESYEKQGNVNSARDSYQKVLEYATPERMSADSHLLKLRERAERALSRLQVSEARRD